MRRFPTFFTVEYGIMDSVKIDLKSENTLDQKLVTREKKSKEDKKKEKPIKTNRRKENQRLQSCDQKFQ